MTQSQTGTPPTGEHDRHAIEAAITTYFECMFESSSDKAEAVFYPSARITGYMNGALQDMSVTDFAGFVAAQQPSPEDQGVEPFLQIVSLEVTGDTAVARVRDTYLGMTFQDTLSFIRSGQGWQIANKLFHIE